MGSEDVVEMVLFYIWCVVGGVGGREGGYFKVGKG